MTTTPNPAEEREPTGDPKGDHGLGDAGKRALEAERKARRDAERRAQEAESKAAELELARTRADVAAELELTDAQAALLQGDTREELEEHARRLRDAFAPSPKPPTQRPTEALRGGRDPEQWPEEDVDRIAARIAGGGF